MCICTGHLGPAKMNFKNNFGHLPAAKLSTSTVINGLLISFITQGYVRMEHAM
jgi:hypothetical protein